MGVLGSITGAAVQARAKTEYGLSQAYRFARAVDRSGGSELTREVAAGVLAARRSFAARADLVRAGRRFCSPLGRQMPNEVRLANFDLVDTALKAAGIPAFSVRQEAPTREVVAVDAKHRASVLKALADTWGDDAVYLQVLVAKSRTDGLTLPAAVAPTSPALARAGVLRVWRYYLSDNGTLLLGPEHGAEIEFWSTDRKSGIVTAPRPNVAADVLTLDDVEIVDGTVGTRAYPTAKVFTRRMLEDIAFPIDAVYTWVDGADPAWRERMERAKAAEEGREYHPGAHGDQRFLQRDELRYSLRSLAMYAPWFRRIFLVTDRQVPEWLAADNPRITVVDHRDIFDDHGVLPVFNSNAIITRLHHIPDLAEHYVFFNDDFFLGRTLRPIQFFTPQGMAKVSPANNRRPFGAAHAGDEPHFNLTRNMRALLEAEFGVTVSRAIKHTPYPQLRSVHVEMEARFAEVYRRTVSSRFRHHEDIVADQLFHYYAQITGRAVPGNLRYDYFNIAVAAEWPRLEQLLRLRYRDVFCLNDAPEPGKEALPEAQVRHFLDSYYPVPSEFERG